MKFTTILDFLIDVRLLNFFILEILFLSYFNLDWSENTFWHWNFVKPCGEQLGSMSSNQSSFVQLSSTQFSTSFL